MDRQRTFNGLGNGNRTHPSAGLLTNHYGQGPGAVGLSTTRAVVAGIVAIIIADSILGTFFYALDI